MQRRQQAGSRIASSVWGASGALGLAIAAVGVGTMGAAESPVTAGPNEAAVRYSRDIRPILADRCFKCHGPDEAANQSGVRLDSFERATAPIGDAHAIAPGDPDASLMLERLRSDDPGHRMPPPETNLTVSEDEIQLIERWIAQGAEYEGHWAFQTPVRPPLPNVSDEDWVRNPIDRFVLARLDSLGIAPSPEADRETLIRRLSLDLTGLPPTPEQIDAFLADDQLGAYERVVDELLASPHYGERMAMYWLDVARYADTNGYHHDNYRTMWPWRDWVIESFNDNTPFDRFVIEQLAGDLLPDATHDTIVATGFCRNHPISDEGGAIEEEYLTEYAADRVETVSTAMLGLTMQCARCHDHKYDPVTQEDYFGLFAFFNSVEERGVPARIEGVNNGAFAPYVSAPSDQQQVELERLAEAITQARTAVDDPIPGLREQQDAWEQGVRTAAGVSWAPARVVSAEARQGATLEVLEDDSILATGENPAKDIHDIVLRTDETDLRLLRLEVLNDERMPEGRAGRAPNGNAVISGIEVDAVSVQDPEQRREVTLSYAWADFEQPNGDFDAQNALRADEGLGWAIGAHLENEPRTLLILADEPFGFEGGTDVHVTLRYESRYSEHTFGRVRLGLASCRDLLPTLPTIFRDWFMAGPFTAGSGDEAFETAFGPEHASFIDMDERFGEGNLGWAHKPEYVDGTPYTFNGERSAFYLGRTVFAPVERTYDVSLGSDDALQVYLNGEELLANNTRRGVAPDQESLTLTFSPGENTLILKVVNEGGPAGFYFKATPSSEEPMTLAPLALTPRELRADHASRAIDTAYRLEVSPEYQRRVEALSEAESAHAALEAELPNVMIMKELPEPRATYVLSRGAYDAPDMDRPVSRQTPRILGTLDEEVRRDRLGLARWLFDEDHPLTSRVAANRLWQVIYGDGLVRTSEDFGSQGEWPSHPELLDWLAVEFRESGWDVKDMLRLIVTSATYRQSSVHRPELAEIDPENRLLARQHRSRLSAELVRDNALAASGLLVRDIGGPSVKPYQPEGLWREVAMLTSNTRFFERDDGADLYRRGLYTFWKRSAPPPQMATFDAPEREVCVVRRGATSTPLQALVLLNDVTYVEIARALAQRVMLETSWPDDPVAAVVRAFRLTTGRRPLPDEVAILQQAYEDAMAGFRAAPDDASALLTYGESPVDDSLDPTELASMTIVASVILNLDETITKD